MGTTWPCFNIDSQAEYSWKKNSCCVFGKISLVSCIMSCSNRMRLLGSLPNTIDNIEPSTQEKTRPLLFQA